MFSLIEPIISCVFCATVSPLPGHVSLPSSSTELALLCRMTFATSLAQRFDCCCCDLCHFLPPVGSWPTANKTPVAGRESPVTNQVDGKKLGRRGRRSHRFGRNRLGGYRSRGRRLFGLVLGSDVPLL